MGAVFAASSGGVSAQSIETNAFIGVSNLEYNGYVYVAGLVYQNNTNGPAEANLAETPFTGLNDSGSSQTLSFSGGVHAYVIAPGQRPGLHVAVNASLLNTFYNSENPPYFDATSEPFVFNPDGVPDNFDASGDVRKVELFSFGGFGTGNLYARYVYRIHGHVSGDGFRGAGIIFQVGNNASEYASFEPNLPNGEIVGTYATHSYPVGNGVTHEQKSTFTVMYGADTQSVPEGSNITGSFDFGETVTLDRIEVVDENNNPVSGWTVTTGSGLDYDLPIFRSDFDPVPPEPEAIASNAEEICARMQRLQPVAPMIMRRTSYCDGPIGAIREIKFRRVGASSTNAQD